MRKHMNIIVTLIKRNINKSETNKVLVFYLRGQNSN